MIHLDGIRLMVSEFVPRGTVIVINDLGHLAERPEEWESMSAGQQIEWAADHGHLVAINDRDLEELTK